MKSVLLFTLTLLFCAGAFAERILEKDSAKRTEVRYSMIGPRNTLLFYTYANQQAVLRILIDNKDESFPISGQVYLFDSSTSAEGLDKWINNQHSDGLYPGVPKPLEVVQLPEGTCSLTKEGVRPETASSPTGGTFTDHKVKISVQDHKIAGKFELKAFEDQSGVFVQTAKESAPN